MDWIKLLFLVLGYGIGIAVGWYVRSGYEFSKYQPLRDALQALYGAAFLTDDGPNGSVDDWNKAMQQAREALETKP